MNRLGLLQGRGGYGLLPEGLADAERAAAALQGTELDYLYSSDQQRAVETARIIRTRLGLSRIRFSGALREMDYGEMQGRPDAEVRRLCPLWRRDATFLFPGGGESFALVQKRAFRWLERALKLHPRGRVGVVTHGGWLRTLFAGLKGVPLSRCLNGTVAHGLVGRLDVSRARGLHLHLEPGVTIFPGR
jgi:2,3-bisphosphoglycerate-dependent phosphoglycerate mutase